MIALYLQVLAVLAIFAGAAVALGNEIRLWIDERHEIAAARRVGRHRRSTYRWIDDASAAFVRRYDTALLFSDADEAFDRVFPSRQGVLV